MGQALTCVPSVWADYKDMQQSLLDEQPMSHCEVEPARVLQKTRRKDPGGKCGTKKIRLRLQIIVQKSANLSTLPLSVVFRANVHLSMQMKNSLTMVLHSVVQG